MQTDPSNKSKNPAKTETKTATKNPHPKRNYNTTKPRQRLHPGSKMTPSHLTHTPEMEISHALYKLKIETTDSSSEEDEDKRNWLELPPDVTSLIFLKLSTIDILGSVQWVCSSWWKLSKQPHLFRSIHVENVSVTIFGYHRDLHVPYNFLVKFSEGLAREAIDRSCGQLVEFSVKDVPIDELLLYMSEKSSSLRSLRLVGVALVIVDISSDDGQCIKSDIFIEEMAKKFSYLEELEIMNCSYFSKDVIEKFGLCHQLKLCRLNNCWGNDDTQFNEVGLVIAENMPELRHLSLLGNLMRHDDLRAILDGCPHLESLDLRLCLRDYSEQDLIERCKNIKVLKLPYDPLDVFEDDYDYQLDGDDYPSDDYASESDDDM